MSGVSGVISVHQHLPKHLQKIRKPIAVSRFTAQIHADYCLPPIYALIPVQKQTGATRFNCPALHQKLFSSPSLSVFLAQALFPLQYFFLPLSIYENVTSSPSLFESH